MLRFRHRFLAGVAVAVLGTCLPRTARAEELNSGRGTLLEMKRAGAFERVMAAPGVVVVDCFADW